MVFIIRFICGWIVFIIIMFLIGICRAICWDWTMFSMTDNDFKKMVGETTFANMFFKKG